MRNFDANTTAAIAAETAKIFWFLDLEFDSATYRYSDCDIPLYYYTSPATSLAFGGDELTMGGSSLVFGAGDAVKYEPNGFKISNIRITADMAIDRAKIDLQNVDLVMSGILLNETVVNRTVKIYFGCLDATNQIIALEKMFHGFVTAWGGMTAKSCPLTLGNYFMFWHKRSLRLAQSTCPWAFKGGTANPECGYSGGAGRCNKTWQRCQALANTINFGGFRWLVALEEKKIWWGMVPGASIET